MRLTAWEIEALTLLVPKDVLAVLGDPADLEATLEESGGAGYFLTVRSPALPQERSVHARPPVLGIQGAVMAGVVVFIEGHELTIDCHAFDLAIPPAFRDGPVLVSLAP